MAKTHKAEFYVQVVPEWSPWDDTKMTGAKVVKMTQKKPTNPVGGSQIVKLVLELDEDLFVPKTPNITVSLSQANINAPKVVEQEVAWKP